MSEQLIQAIETTHTIVIQSPGAVQPNGAPVQEFVGGYESEEAALRHVREAMRNGYFEAKLNNIHMTLLLGPGTKFMIMSSLDLNAAMANAKAQAMRAEAELFQQQQALRAASSNGRNGPHRQ